MDHRIPRSSAGSPTDSTSASKGQEGQEAFAQAVHHPVLSRLMEEVRNERRVESRYDRVHNRHNRGR